MQDALLSYLIDFLIACGGAWFVCMSFFWRFSRRCTGLEFRVLDLEARATSVAGRDLAKKRWDKDKQFETEMAQIMQDKPARSRKYDNDPLGE